MQAQSHAMNGVFSMKINADRLPGVSDLYKDYVNNFDKVAAFYEFDFHHESSFKNQVEKVQARNYPREALGRILHRQNSKFGAGERTFDSIECLEKNNANVIITGQQVGLFGGPLFVIYKALTTIKLAEKLGRTCQNGFVPVFWLASDDSDFAEVNHVNFIGRDNSLNRAQLELEHNQKQPMGQTQLTPAIDELFKTFPEYFHDTEFKSTILNTLQDAYNSQSSMSDAFAQWLMFCLKDFGIVLIDPSAPEIKELVTDIYYHEIKQRSPSTTAVINYSEKLQESGYHNQIQIREGRYNLFYHSAGRTGLEMQDGAIVSSDSLHTFSEKEMLAELQEYPQKFSPNVALRALTQDTLFPTIAYVAGPAEVAYFAQLKGVYQAFDVPMPIIYPRKSATIIEPAIDRLLDKFSLDATDIWQPVDRLFGDIVRGNVPDTFFDAILKLQNEIPGKLSALQDEIIKIDPTLEKMLQNTAGKIQSSIDNLEKKTVQAARRKETQIQDQLTRLADAIYPNQTLQERVLNYVPMMIKYGPEFIEKVYDDLTISSFDHQLIRM
ncbi:MAG: bacillithiol biosynthesis cysteine-adding enzyme BshC [Calditrichaeota bacterium]|nr:MAG: bacillithiol biosynthesis cysteine-adding enzyme BshC [Calditrichota bacterium]